MQEMNLMPTLAEANLPMPVEQVPPELDEPSAIDKLKAADGAREGFPGEHWLVRVVRTAGAFAASALVARAASGREGLSKVLRYTPFGRGISNCPPSEHNPPRK